MHKWLNWIKSKEIPAQFGGNFLLGLILNSNFTKETIILYTTYKKEVSEKRSAMLHNSTVDAQINLAKEIGENQGYQNYLIAIREIEAHQAIGIEQAKALMQAEIKIIANAGNGKVSEGLKSVSEIFSAKGGTEIGAMLEGIAQSDFGKNLLNKFSKKSES